MAYGGQSQQVGCSLSFSPLDFILLHFTDRRPASLGGFMVLGRCGRGSRSEGRCHRSLSRLERLRQLLERRIRHFAGLRLQCRNLGL